MYAPSYHNHLPPHTSPLSLHDALPIFAENQRVLVVSRRDLRRAREILARRLRDLYRQDVPTFAEVLLTSGSVVDRKSTRLNSSHLGISYAVFCLKKK